ncbi:MAG: hypothetical protein OK454_08300, partial [Thaumarchaeota archaeon]|nr:hypothetical protein [Nitrososphaerota archaeon]
MEADELLPSGALLARRVTARYTRKSAETTAISTSQKGVGVDRESRGTVTRRAKIPTTAPATNAIASAPEAVVLTGASNLSSFCEVQSDYRRGARSA